MDMQGDQRKLASLAAKMGISVAALEQYLQLKQREAAPPADPPLRKPSAPNHREPHVG
jgi:hypothetical protein